MVGTESQTANSLPPPLRGCPRWPCPPSLRGAALPVLDPCLRSNDSRSPKGSLADEDTDQVEFFWEPAGFHRRPPEVERGSSGPGPRLAGERAVRAVRAGGAAPGRAARRGRRLLSGHRLRRRDSLGSDPGRRWRLDRLWVRAAGDRQRVRYGERAWLG